ncbi:hypothetical protein MXAN_6897 [Myxococcus xanthus DK 1622]|uniref:Uncharacterized protein n=1 Tax=Myxococcus xanthus (strain DK1622) TaxID=246197 RepID=Q1CX62_MYXXD|nr:hypothetical protein MXAN_6897 [Myxococcus xanthus DK 1622]
MPGLRRPRSHSIVFAEQCSTPRQSPLSEQAVEQVLVAVSQVPPQGQWASAKHSTQEVPSQTVPGSHVTAHAPEFSHVRVVGLHTPLPQSPSSVQPTQVLPCAVPLERQKGVSPSQAPQRGPQCLSVVQDAHSPLRQNWPSPHSKSLRHWTQTSPSRQ